jgi:hypothetical protein
MIAFSADSAGGTFVINADGSGLRMLSPSVYTLSSQVRNGAMNPKLRKAPVLRARIAVPKRSFACK